MPRLQDSAAVHFVQETCLQRKEIRSYKKPEISPAPPYKTYPLADKVTLPRDWHLTEARLSPLLQKRRSLRRFSKKPLSLHSLSYMLWASQGITAASASNHFRTSPSAGALYPIETYIAVHKVENLAPGIYHFDVAKFELELLKPGDHADDIALACLNQQFLADAAVVFLWTAVYRRNLCKYGERGLRYIFMDVGHVCQNVLLAAEANGSGGCPVAAFFDDELNQILELDSQEETTLYLAGVGSR